MKIVIISDLHANAEALAAIDESFDEMWVLGDLINYGPEPGAAIEFVRAHAAAVVRGNHDHSVGYDEDPRCAPRFAAMADATRKFCGSVLTAEQKWYLGGLPLHTRREADGRSFLLCHATPSNPLYEYCPPDSERWEVEVRAVDADVVVVGHTHLPFVRRFGEQMVANPGSLGQSKAGQPGACYAVWKDGEIKLKSVPYAVEKTVAKLEVMALADGVRRDLITVLRTGAVPR